MTNLQLFIAVVIPSALMVVNLVSIHRLEARLDARMDRLEEKVQRIEVALANLRAELYEKFELKSHA